MLRECDVDICLVMCFCNNMCIEDSDNYDCETCHVHEWVDEFCEKCKENPENREES